MQKEPHIVAFYGPQRAGKSEAAKAFAHIPTWVKLSFADPLYQMMSVVLGRDARAVDKKAELPELGGRTLRRALQTLGTEWGRQQMWESIWLNQMARAIRQQHRAGKNVVIDDLRFANEYRFLREYGATIIMVGRAGSEFIRTPADGHTSEADWWDFEPDFSLSNPMNGVKEWQQYVRDVLRAELQL